MGWSAIATQVTTQSGVYQSQAATGVNTAVDADTGTITAGANWSAIRDGHAFAIVRAGAVVAVRCAKSIAANVLTYYRLYLEDGTELATDVQVGDTIELFETTTEVGAGTALGAVVGITLTTIGASAQIGRIFAIGDNRTAVGGSFQVFPNDIIYYGTAAPASNMTVNAGGRLVVGCYTTRSGVTNFSEGCVLRGTKSEANSTVAFVLVNSATARMDWFGGTIEAGGAINDVASATTTCYSKNCVHRSLGTTIFYQIRTSSTAFRTYGLTMDGNGGLIHIGNPNVAGLQAVHCDSVLNLSSTTPANTWLSNKGGRLVGGNAVDVAFWSSRWMRIINQHTGSAVTVGGNSVGASGSNRGLQEYRQEVTIAVTNLAGAGVDGVRWMCRDINNGSRLAANAIGTNPDYTADRTYEGVTAGGGSASILTDGGVLTAVAYQNLASASVTRFQSVVWDRRGLDNSSTDRFRFLLAAYGYKPDSVVLVLKGMTPAVLGRALLVDSNITQANPATVAAYATIDNLDRLYDRAALWLTESGANMELAGAGNFLVNGNGTELGLGALNLVVDPAAAVPFAVSGNTVTIKASTLAAGTKFATLRTTGTLTLLNGATMGISYTTGAGSFAAISITGLVAGSRIQFYNETDAVEIYNGAVAGTSYSAIFPWPGIRTVRARASIEGQLDYEQSAQFLASGLSFVASQPNDPIYIKFNTDGSTVTEIVPDFPNIQADVNDPDGILSIKRIYAWYHHICETEEGIRNFFGAILAEDEFNLKILTGKVNLRLQNVGATPVRIVDGRIYRDDGTTIIAAGGSIEMDPGKAYTSNSTLIEQLLSELHAMQGLKAGSPMTVTPTTRTAAGITLEISGDGTTSTTVTRT